MICESGGGQQFVGAAPAGRSTGPHFETSMGAAKPNGDVAKLVAPTITIFLLSNMLAAAGCTEDSSSDLHDILLLWEEAFFICLGLLTNEGLVRGCEIKEEAMFFWCSGNALHKISIYRQFCWMRAVLRLFFNFFGCPNNYINIYTKLLLLFVGQILRN